MLTGLQAHGSCPGNGNQGRSFATDGDHAEQMDIRRRWRDRRSGQANGDGTGDRRRRGKRLAPRGGKQGTGAGLRQIGQVRVIQREPQFKIAVFARGILGQGPNRPGNAKQECQQVGERAHSVALGTQVAFDRHHSSKHVLAIRDVPIRRRSPQRQGGNEHQRLPAFDVVENVLHILQFGEEREPERRTTIRVLLLGKEFDLRHRSSMILDDPGQDILQGGLRDRNGVAGNVETGPILGCSGWGGHGRRGNSVTQIRKDVRLVRGFRCNILGQSVLVQS
ncbi:hypothetical protein SI859A1_02128 [Aurantimonas manganoxydans SI85-9A1]|uniref:Uncharacterized protein n=1 Tax=Aurantimonas manganoxydans (strain ATCC BAA-1229 / DSM 21871 / SI85-9A1) TaxID=287752 RepID=Q1YMR8_AURMS|nr:hypothetical protein SI859A1_02128 [Aurantimonas manganoxydans SI85-9A1]